MQEKGCHLPPICPSVPIKSGKSLAGHSLGRPLPVEESSTRTERHRWLDRFFSPLKRLLPETSPRRRASAPTFLQLQRPENALGQQGNILVNIKQSKPIDKCYYGCLVFARIKHTPSSNKHECARRNHLPANVVVYWFHNRVLWDIVGKTPTKNGRGEGRRPQSGAGRYSLGAAQFQRVCVHPLTFTALCAR